MSETSLERFKKLPNEFVLIILTDNQVCLGHILVVFELPGCLGPGGFPGFPQIRPSLGVDISELKRS